MTNEQKIQQVLNLLKKRKIVVFDSGKQCLDRFTVVHNKHYQANGRPYGFYVACSASGGFYQHGEFSNFRQFIRDLSSNKDFKRLPSTTDFKEVFCIKTLSDFYDSFLS